jgi:hypothetical protein
MSELYELLYEYCIVLYRKIVKRPSPDANAKTIVP